MAVRISDNRMATTHHALCAARQQTQLWWSPHVRAATVDGRGSTTGIWELEIIATRLPRNTYVLTEMLKLLQGEELTTMVKSYVRWEPTVVPCHVLHTKVANPLRVLCVQSDKTTNVIYVRNNFTSVYISNQIIITCTEQYYLAGNNWRCKCRSFMQCVP